MTSTLSSMLLVLLVLLLLFVLPRVFGAAMDFCIVHRAWRTLRILQRAAPYMFGTVPGRAVAFHYEMFALRETGDLAGAVAAASARLSEKMLPPWSRNVAIDVLISAGAYEA